MLPGNSSHSAGEQNRIINQHLVLPNNVLMLGLLTSWHNLPENRDMLIKHSFRRCCDLRDPKWSMSAHLSLSLFPIAFKIVHNLHPFTFRERGLRFNENIQILGGNFLDQLLESGITFIYFEYINVYEIITSCLIRYWLHPFVTNPRFWVIFPRVRPN